jgi:hypothetical protein
MGSIAVSDEQADSPTDDPATTLLLSAQAQKGCADEAFSRMFAKVVETFQGRVYKRCFRILGNAHRAEEATHQTFIWTFASGDKHMMI